jgi:chitin disaccharide deacetylase
MNYGSIIAAIIVTLAVMPNQKLLVVNADDLALHPSVNHAIFKAHQEGIVTSCSILAGGSAFQDAVQQAKRLPSLGVGIHLCLVDQFPILPVQDIPSLVDAEGSLHRSYSIFLKKYCLGKIKTEEVRRELIAQVSRIIDSGVKITHLDGHQHLHVLPSVVEIVADISRKFGITRVRIPQENIMARISPISPSRKMQRAVLNRLAQSSRKKLALAGMASTDYFFGFSGGGNMTKQLWMKLIPLLPVGSTEVMVHPGSHEQELRTATGWNYHWAAELTALCDSEVTSLLQKNNVKLIHYGAIA